MKDLKWYNKNGYCRTTSTQERCFLHQYLLDYFSTEYDIDHLDGDSRNNRRSNLKIKSHKDNIRNMHKGKIRGILITPNKKYSARITVDYKEIYLGTFSTYEDAVQARREAELKYFGKYVN